MKYSVFMSCVIFSFSMASGVPSVSHAEAAPAKHRTHDGYGTEPLGNDGSGKEKISQTQNRKTRDDRIKLAISIAQSRGRVLDAGWETGSVFWVRVATETGRVDYLVDTKVGRIIGEK